MTKPSGEARERYNERRRTERQARADAPLLEANREREEERKAASGGGKGKKKRNWAFVVYPESAPPDWLERLQLTGLKCAVSPLHDKDVNPDGEIKKAHCHVIAAYGGPTSFDVVKRVTDGLNAPRPVALEQMGGYYRYLTHKDNPEKWQYDERDIVAVNGFCIGDFVAMTAGEEDAIRRSLLAYIREQGIVEYSVLIDALVDGERHAEFGVASRSTIFFDKYIASRRNVGERRR